MKNNIVSGKNTSTFAPSDPVTRAEFVTFLWRLAGKPSATATVTFTDMPSNSDYRAAITWAVSKKIASGKSETHFAPYETVSRQDAIVFLYRYYAETFYAAEYTKSCFTDVDSNKYYSKAVLWGESTGIVKGLGSDRFGVGNKTKRSQAITMIYRAENRES